MRCNASASSTLLEPTRLKAGGAWSINAIRSICQAALLTAINSQARPFGRFSNHWIVIRSTRGWVDLFGEIKSKNRVTPTSGSRPKSNAEATVAYCTRPALNSSINTHSKSTGSNKTKSLTAPVSRH